MSEAHIGIITNYRIGLKTQRNQECLLKVLDIGPEESSKLVGWRVAWPVNDPKLFGTISKPHGRTGTLRARFQKGLPGQALGSKVKIVSEKHA